MGLEGRTSFNSESLGNGWSVRRCFSISRLVVSITAVTLRSPTDSLLLLPYLRPPDAMLDGVCGVFVTPRCCGDDVFCCDTEDEGCGLRKWLRLVVERSPTDTILAATGEELGGLEGGSARWRGSDPLISEAACFELGQLVALVARIGLEG